MPAAELLGRDDFDAKLPWVHQAAKYRADDEAVTIGILGMYEMLDDATGRRLFAEQRSRR